MFQTRKPKNGCEAELLSQRSHEIAWPRQFPEKNFYNRAGYYMVREEQARKNSEAL
jgi:hypothetical protein